MKKRISFIELRDSLKGAQDRLNAEKSALSEILPLEAGFNREQYVLAYTQAEQYGLKTIRKMLKGFDWLPVKLDPENEFVSENPALLLVWLQNGSKEQPSAQSFGNDFVHALARSGLMFGWDDLRTARLAQRIACLFRDLCCLVGVVYFSSFLTEEARDDIALTNPQDIVLTAKEFAELIEAEKKKFSRTYVPPSNASKRSSKKKPSFLHLVSDQDAHPPT